MRISQIPRYYGNNKPGLLTYYQTVCRRFTHLHLDYMDFLTEFSVRFKNFYSVAMSVHHGIKSGSPSQVVLVAKTAIFTQILKKVLYFLVAKQATGNLNEVARANFW